MKTYFKKFLLSCSTIVISWSSLAIANEATINDQQGEVAQKRVLVDGVVGLFMPDVDVQRRYTIPVSRDPEIAFKTSRFIDSSGVRRVSLIAATNGAMCSIEFFTAHKEFSSSHRLDPKTCLQFSATLKKATRQNPIKITFDDQTKEIELLPSTAMENLLPTQKTTEQRPLKPPSSRLNTGAQAGTS